MDTLAEQLSGDQFTHLKAAYPTQWNLLAKKGVYCYDYMGSMERFDETSLPRNEHFFNKLAGEHISEKQYQHAENVWEKIEV